MSLFLTTFFVIYGGMHLYVFLKARAAFSPGIMGSVIICFFMVFMVLAPMLSRFAERADLENLAMVIAYAGYTWMGAMLIFFATGICTELFRLFAFITGVSLGKDVSPITSAHRVYFIISLAASFFVAIYGSFEARSIKPEHVVIETKKIPSDAGRVRIAQISDVHLGLIVGEERLKKIIDVVRHAKPDVLVSTGDLLDGQPDRVDLLVGYLKDIDVPYGKFAVTGNHEAYLDYSNGRGLSRELTEKAGFKLMNHDVIALSPFIALAGVEDEAGRGWRHGVNDREENMCSSVDPSRFTILLKHRPVPYTGPLCAYDLQLSGHTHKGQIFPFFFITRLFFKLYEGLYELSNGTYLYVSRGSGTWGPPIRFLASPEVAIIDLVPKTK